MDPLNKLDQLNTPTDKKVTHTFEGDMALAIQENKDGLVKKIIHEQEEKELEKRRLIIYSIKNKIYIGLTLIFILLAASVIAYLYFKDDVDSFFVKKRFSPLIFHESSTLIDISDKNKDDIISTVIDEVNKKERTPEEVTGIYFLQDKKTVGFNLFLSLIESNFSGTKDLFNENFLIGIIKQPLPVEIVENIPETKTDDPDQAKKLLDNYITLSSTDFFKPGTTEFLNTEASTKAKELIGYFLDTVSFDYSKVKIIGTFPIEKTSPKNQELAESLKKAGVSLFNEVLKEKYTPTQITKFSLESLSKCVSIADIYTVDELAKMSEVEKNQKIDLNQGIQYLSEARIKPITPDSSNPVVPVTPVADTTKEVVSNFPTGTDLFILLKVNSFADVFNQMRIWENKMFTDLHDFFGVDISIDTSYLLTKDFVDGVIQNKNARILYDNTGKIVMMYVYIDDSSVVIANNEETTREVILRVNSSKIKK